MDEVAAIKLLDWDSNFLGFQVGRLYAQGLDTSQVQEQLSSARAAGYRLLYWSLRPDDLVAAASAQAIGATLIDRKIRIVQPIVNGPVELPIGITPTTRLTPEMQNLAVQASEHSRFRLDSNFGPEVAPALYIKWLQRALNGELAREVLQYQADALQPVIGMLILGTVANRTEMIMMAVDSASRGQGIGQMFIEAARRRARLWELPQLQLVTQATNPACRLYEREGFCLEHEEHVYHLWL